MITAHMIVKNEEQWVWFAVNSVINFVDKIIIYDTGSTDETVDIIKSIKSYKIEFEEKGSVTPEKLVDLRNEQINKTKTDWFMLLDGDEVWSEKSLSLLLSKIQSAPKDKISAVVRSRNCVGDIFHYLPENRGKYNIMGMVGHFNIRAFRKSPDYCWKGVYPLEAYANANGTVNNQDEKLIFVDTYYWHLTHLKRSSVSDSFKKNKRKLEFGIKSDKKEIPEIFFSQKPEIVPDPFIATSFIEKLLAIILTIVKDIKYKLNL